MTTVAEMKVAEPSNHKAVRALCSSVSSTSLLAYARPEIAGAQLHLVELGEFGFSPSDAPARKRPRGNINDTSLFPKVYPGPRTAA